MINKDETRRSHCCKAAIQEEIIYLVNTGEEKSTWTCSECRTKVKPENCIKRNDRSDVFDTDYLASPCCKAEITIDSVYDKNTGDDYFFWDCLECGKRINPQDAVDVDTLSETDAETYNKLFEFKGSTESPTVILSGPRPEKRPAAETQLVNGRYVPAQPLPLYSLKTVLKSLFCRFGKHIPGKESAGIFCSVCNKQLITKDQEITDAIKAKEKQNRIEWIEHFDHMLGIMRQPDGESCRVHSEKKK